MKVLKRPETSNWTYKHTCNGCECELEIEVQDLKHIAVAGDMREPGYDSFRAHCSVCEAVIEIPANKIPKLIKIQTINKYKSDYWDR